jgi:DNA-binding MarR family transcriptional regulator
VAQTEWLEEEQARMWRSYLDMQRDLERALERQLAEAGGLSSADYALLVPLSEAEDHRLRARDLGRLSGWDRSRLSHHIRRMEQRGLVSRHTCATDLRGTYIQIEDRGVEALKQAAPGHVETVRKYLIDQLTPAEVATMRHICERVSARISADAGTDDCPSDDSCAGS